VKGKVTRNCPKMAREAIGCVSLELHQRLIAREEERDEARFFSGRRDTYAKARQTILSASHDKETEHQKFDRVVELLEIDYFLDRGIRFLSTGEIQKVLIARALMKSPTLLILDEPCQGLDKSNRELILELTDYIGRKTHTHILYVTHHQDEIPACITHVLRLETPETGGLFVCSMGERQTKVIHVGETRK